jgi:8-oxo-dGTP pyrophosphatase MutT (NUDIX family)/GNAT superfamily N-acetyltransferase
MMEYIKNMRKHIGHERLLIVGASVFVHKNGKLLLQKRRDNDCWADHGGCIELGETAEETAMRELYEETGLTACTLELIGVFSGKELFYTYPNGDMVSNVNIAYLCEEFSGDLIKQTDETVDLTWFDLENLPENISPPVIPALKRCVEILKGREVTKTSFHIESVENYREFVNKQIADDWAGPFIVSKGILHDTRIHNGFVALADREVVGYILYNLIDGDCEITVLESIHEGRGIGKALINEVIKIANEEHCSRVWLITTNDNNHAIRFYQRFGFMLRGVYINAMDDARILKPQIPLTGNDGIPIAHEFEFERLLR